MITRLRGRKYGKMMRGSGWKLRDFNLCGFKVEEKTGIKWLQREVWIMLMDVIGLPEIQRTYFEQC